MHRDHSATAPARLAAALTLLLAAGYGEAARAQAGPAPGQVQAQHSSGGNADRDRRRGRDPREPLVLETMGAGPFGGTAIGLPDSSLHCDHGYVEWFIPPNARRLPLLMIHASSTRTWQTTFDGREGFQPTFLRRGFAVYMTDLPRTGRAGQGCARTTYEPEVGFDQTGFTVWRLGLWPLRGGDPTPNFYPGVQFPVNDPRALDEFLRIQYPEFNAPENEQVETDALAVLLEEIGPSVLLTHSSTGIRGWITATKSTNVAAIVSYEPGNYAFPAGEAPTALPDGTPVTGGVNPIPLAEFQKLTKFPIQIVWGDYVPTQRDPNPSLEFRRQRLVISQLFAAAVNRHGGDAEVLVLPEIGVTGNTHFPMLDLNSQRIANLLSQYLRDHGIDRRGRGSGRRGDDGPGGR
jgi:hypothetical protein